MVLRQFDRCFFLGVSFLVAGLVILVFGLVGRVSVFWVWNGLITCPLRPAPYIHGDSRPRIKDKGIRLSVSQRILGSDCLESKGYGGMVIKRWECPVLDRGC